MPSQQNDNNLIDIVDGAMIIEIEKQDDTLYYKEGRIDGRINLRDLAIAAVRIVRIYDSEHIRTLSETDFESTLNGLRDIRRR